MSCPDWTAETAWRAGDGAAPREWPDRLAHLAACPDCRRRVARLDPTLLLAAAAAPAPLVDRAERDAMASAVRSLVSSSRLAARARSGRRLLVAAAAVVVLLATPLGLRRLLEPPPAPSAVEVVAAALPEPDAEALVEEVQPAGARVYQFGSDELPVVLIVDENLDL